MSQCPHCGRSFRDEAADRIEQLEAALAAAYEEAAQLKAVLAAVFDPEARDNALKVTVAALVASDKRRAALAPEP